MSTKAYNLKGFTGVKVGGNIEFDITQSDSFGVSVTYDDLSHILVEKIEHTLVIRRHGVEWFAPFHNRPKVTITMPVLTELNITGASHGRIKDFQSDVDFSLSLTGGSHLEVCEIAVGKLKVNVTGASGLTGDIKTVNNANFEATGASKLELAGIGAEIDVKASGASKIELSKFPVEKVKVHISGASNVFINLNGRLDATLSGASTLLWTGTPVMGDIQTSGASSLQHG